MSNVKKVSLELGGKSPLVIFSDCDMDRAVKYVSELNMRTFKTVGPTKFWNELDCRIEAKKTKM